MQVGSKISYKINKNANSNGNAYKTTNSFVPAFKKPQNNLSFGQENQCSSESKENPKSQFSLKHLTNVAGVAIGIGAILLPVIAGLRQPATTKLMKSTENLSKNINIAQESAEEIIKKSAPDYKTGNAFYRAGISMDKMVEKGEELINNLVYGFGTVVIMPLVILFSPIGKKKSSKEDKMFTVLRQPLSFVTMFSMQLTVDKFFKNLVPQFIKKNLLEASELLDEKGNIKKDANLEKVRFNSGVIKSDFDDTLKKVAGWSDDSIKQLFKFKDHAPVKDELQKQLGKDLEKGKIKPEQVEMLTKKLNNYFIAKNREKLLCQSLVIAANVLFSAPVGCTLLNVLYGKAMKEFKSKPQNTQQDNAAKGGNN